MVVEQTKYGAKIRGTPEDSFRQGGKSFSTPLSTNEISYKLHAFFQTSFFYWSILSLKLTLSVYLLVHIWAQEIGYQDGFS